MQAISLSLASSPFHRTERSPRSTSQQYSFFGVAGLGSSDLSVLILASDHAVAEKSNFYVAQVRKCRSRLSTNERLIDAIPTFVRLFSTK